VGALLGDKGDGIGMTLNDYEVFLRFGEYSWLRRS